MSEVALDLRNRRDVKIEMFGHGLDGREIKMVSRIDKAGNLVLRPRMRDWREWGLYAIGLVRAWLAQDGSTIELPARPTWRDWIVFASGKTNYYITKVLNWFFNATAFTPPATLYFALWTSALTAASTGSTAGETTYTGYARVAMTANTTNFPLSAGGSAIQNAVAVTFGADTVGTPSITYVAICDASTAGNMLYWGSITSTAIAVGDTPQINVNGMTASEA